MSELVAKLLKERERRPGQRDDETKAQFFWRVLRESIRETSKLVAKADARDIQIAHGVHHLRKINHLDPIRSVLYNSEKAEYLTINNQGFNIFYLDGRYKDRIEPEEHVDKLLYARSAKRYVGWIDDEEYLKVFQDDFELISEAKSPFKISCVAYNDHQGEIVSAGQGHVLSWCFRYGAKHLIQKKITTEGLPANDNYWLIALEETASRTQRCFVACDSNVAVVNLFEGTVLSYRKNLHVRNISCILFFNPLKYLITGARDGSIKVWDDGWDLRLVFVGHRGPVTALAIFPYGPSIMSGSEDCTIRVWSMETYDEVDLIQTNDPVEGLGTVLNNDNIHSYSANTVHLWRLRQIHNLFTAIGSKVVQIKTTNHPDVPTRVMCTSRNGTVRIVTPGTGDVITSFIAGSGKQVVDAAYASAQEILFVALRNGDILRADASTNPCRIVHRVNTKLASDKETINCICLYEYVVQSTLQNDSWKGIMKSLKATKSAQQGKIQSKDRTLLIAGRKDGCISVLDWKTLTTLYKTDAHGLKGVLGIVANPKNDQLITSGMDFGMMDDNVLKIWRVFPFAEESLAPLMSIYCAHTPLHMSVMKNTLCVAFQDPSSVTYSLVHYNLLTKSRNDHSPDEDHIDTVTGLACNPRMRYFASSSLDGTIKIWDEYNRLIRSIKLNAEPYSLNFCTDRGDLLVGIGNHVHRIDHTSYLPRPFLRKMVSMIFHPPSSEDVIPYDEDLSRALSPLGKKRLKTAHSSIFKFDNFVDVLTKEETEELSREKKVKEEAFAVLAEREMELQRLRDGKLHSSKWQPPPRDTSASSRIKNDAFRRYWHSMHLHTDKPRIPAEDDFNPDGGDSDGESEAPWVPEIEPNGFFPPLSTARRPRPPKREARNGGGRRYEEVEGEEGGINPPIHPSGFIPNSILLRLLWPPEERKISTESPYRPPQLTESQLAEIATRKKQFMESPERVFVWDEEEEDIELPKEDTSSQNQDREPSEISLELEMSPKSSLADKFNIDLTRSPSPKEIPPEEPTPEPEVQPQEPVEEPKGTPPPVVPEPVVPVVEEKQPSPEPKSPSPPPPPPSPPRPPTPLPVFISQFIGSEWFDEYFPNASSRTFPKPWTVTAFINMLLRLIKISDYAMKTPICFAILKLHQQEPLTAAPLVVETILSILNRGNGPSYQEEDQKEFVVAAIHMMRDFGIHTIDVVVELMCLFLDGDKDIRELVGECFFNMGLNDDHNYFFKEMDSWDIWNIEEENRKPELTGMCRKWLEKWMSHFKSHLKKTIEQLKKGKVQGSIQRAPKKSSPASSASSKSILKKSDQSDGSSPFNDKASESGLSEVTSEGSKGKYSPAPPSEPQQLTVTFDVPPDASSIENATPIEAINYFVEIELERYLEKMRLAKAREEAAKDQASEKNTIVVLPKIQGGSASSLVGRESFDDDLESRFSYSRELQFDDQKSPGLSSTGFKTARELFEDMLSKPNLVRLGETHTSRCNPHRSTNFQRDFKLPPIIQHASQLPAVDGLYKFTNKIDFPMKTFYMNPFPGPIDLYEELHQPILLTLKSSQKYFMPQDSIVNPENFR
ncbi:uncharacterized protein [Apostichopus japonicus]|uniref:uncharacterized protein isoform X3 n=1 Tax=Stichopus japonicus TaxID=307972 RepID=UPI003AB54324